MMSLCLARVVFSREWLMRGRSHWKNKEGDRGCVICEGVICVVKSPLGSLGVSFCVSRF